MLCARKGETTAYRYRLRVGKQGGISADFSSYTARKTARWLLFSDQNYCHTGWLGLSPTALGVSPSGKAPVFGTGILGSIPSTPAILSKRSAWRDMLLSLPPNFNPNLVAAHKGQGPRRVILGENRFGYACEPPRLHPSSQVRRFARKNGVIGQA
jgi:hypothetical protein